MFLKKAKFVITGLMLLLLVGCASKPDIEDGSDGADSSISNGYPNSETGYNSSYNDPNYGQRGTKDRVIYFDYASDALRTESHNVVAAHAQALKASPSKGMLLEGHTDERGSREYNLGLGERRAKSVRQMMISQGANPAQIRVMSYGKERPAVSGSDESAYSQNRRVEIVY